MRCSCCPWNWLYYHHPLLNEWLPTNHGKHGNSHFMSRESKFQRSQGTFPKLWHTESELKLKWLQLTNPCLSSLPSCISHQISQTYGGSIRFGEGLFRTLIKNFSETPVRWFYSGSLMEIACSYEVICLRIQIKILYPQAWIPKTTCGLH